MEADSSISDNNNNKYCILFASSTIQLSSQCFKHTQSKDNTKNEITHQYKYKMNGNRRRKAILIDIQCFKYQSCPIQMCF